MSIDAGWHPENFAFLSRCCHPRRFAASILRGKGNHTEIKLDVKRDSRWVLLSIPIDQFEVEKNQEIGRKKLQC